MKYIFNGSDREDRDGITVAALVAEQTESGEGVAVAVNDAVVPRSAWESTALADGDRVEMLTAVQGG